MHIQHLIIKTQDGFPLHATQFTPPESKASLVIAAGLGIPRHFYRHIALYAGSRAYQVTTFDYRGINESQDEKFRGRDMRFSHWGKKDLHAVLAHVKKISPLPLTYMGHSGGGQVLGMTPLCEKVSVASFIASPLPASENFSRLIERLRIWTLWSLILPMLSLFGDQVPASKIGLSTIDVPTGVVREWSAWGRSKRYLFDSQHQLDLSNYPKLTSALKVIALGDDTLSPAACCFDLADQYPNTKRFDQELHPKDYSLKNVGHFGYFRKSSEILWGELFDWYDEQLIMLMATHADVCSD